MPNQGDNIKRPRPEETNKKDLIARGDYTPTPVGRLTYFILRGLSLLAILFAALARAGKNTVWLTVGIFALTWVQMLVFVVGGMLTGAGPENPTVPGAWAVATHAVTGLLIIFCCYWLMLRARRLDKTGSVARPADAAQQPAATV